ncbi:MAG: hypothetical protein RL199_2162 [Pseudomonadota bacterium]|jgi:HlyD family secretion protein
MAAAVRDTFTVDRPGSVARRALTGAVVVGAVAWLVWALWHTPPVPVDLVRVTRGRLAEQVVEDGVTRLSETYDVTAPRAGLLRRLALEPGDIVRKEDPLAFMEASPAPLLDARARREATERLASAEAMQGRAEATIRQTESAAVLARQEAERARRLHGSGALSDEELQKAEASRLSRDAEWRAARLAATSAEADVRQVRATLAPPRATGDALMPVEAPVDGVVLTVMRKSAGPVTAGERLLTVGDPSSLEVVMDVLTTLAVAVRPGQPVRLTRWGGVEVEGRVRRVEPSAFETKSALGVEERRVNVIVVPTGLPVDAPLGDGFHVEGRIETWSANDVVRVPKSVLFRDPQGWAAFAVDHGRAQLRRPVIGREGATDAQVLSGLGEGEELVAYPTEEVLEGVRVTRRAP